MNLKENNYLKMFPKSLDRRPGGGTSSCAPAPVVPPMVPKKKNRPNNRAHRFRRPRTLPARVCSYEIRLAPYRLHVAEPASRLSDARVRERLLDGAVQHDGVLVRLHGGRVPARRTAQRVLAEPVLQHAAAAAGQTLGVIERRQVSAGQRPLCVTFPGGPVQRYPAPFKGKKKFAFVL